MKKYFLMMLIAFTSLTVALAQNAGNKDKVYETVEVMPNFIGGQQALFSYIASHVKYPAQAEKQKIEGRTLVSFVVKKDGEVSDVKVGKSSYPLLDQEAVRVVRSMPKWEPGRIGNKKVNVRYYIPIEFKLK